MMPPQLCGRALPCRRKENERGRRDSIPVFLRISRRQGARLPARRLISAGNPSIPLAVDHVSGHPVRMPQFLTVRVSRFVSCATFGLLLASNFADHATAQYATSPSTPLAVWATATDDVQPKVVDAPNGGKYISFLSGSGYDVRLARLNADGTSAWSGGSVLVEDRALSSTTDFGLSSDALGNAYVCFDSGASIKLVSIDPTGAVRWTRTVGSGSVGRTTVASDGAAWACFIEGSATRVQRYTTDGTATLGAGVLLNETGASMFSADIQPSVGGAVIVSCVRYTTFTGAKILRAHRVNADGTKPWAANGTSVFTTGSLQFGNFPSFIPDGAGGAYFSWYATNPLQSFVQRVNDAGAVQYGTSGIAVTTTTTGAERVSPSIALGADGRLYCFWSQHTPNSSIYGVYGQCFAKGARVWGNSGVAIEPLATTYSRSWATAARVGNGIACFYDDSPSAVQDNIECAGLASDGTVSWRTDVANNSGVKYRLIAASDTADGAILAWQGGASTGASDVFAGRIAEDGTIGPPVAGNPADLDGDGAVGAPDLSLLLGNWGNAGVGDIDADGTVGAADLALLLAAWVS